MKNLLVRYGNLVTAFAILMAGIVTHSACCYNFHQPKAPDAARKLRNF